MDFSSIKNGFTDRIPELIPQSETVIHYTSLQSAYNIIKTGLLRFTSSLCMNDTAEIDYGTDLLNKTILDSNEIFTNYGLSIGNNNYLEQNKISPFVFCMSQSIEDEDFNGELSQWRIYGAAGAGVAFVFNNDHIVHNANNATLKRVLYDTEEARIIIKKQIISFLDKIQELEEITKKAVLNDPTLWKGLLYNRLSWFPSVIKHKAFRHEREARLISLDSTQKIFFPESPAIIKPYIELPFVKTYGSKPNDYLTSSIRRIIVGPAGNQRVIVNSIQLLLKSIKFDIEVVQSDIPFKFI